MARSVEALGSVERYDHPVDERLTETPEPRVDAPKDRRSTMAVLLCILAYLVLGAMANLHAWVDGAAGTLQSGGGIGDVGQSVWSLGFTPSSLLHGHRILTTDWLNAPWGYNLMANTSIILPALVMAPITLVLGPVVSFNAAVVLAFAGSATVTMLVLRRYTTWLPAAFVGGLLAAFSPAMATQGALHLHLIIEVVPPLVLLVLDELLVRQRHRAWVLGLGLGLLATAQLLISAEVLMTTGLLSLVGILSLCLLRHRQVRSHLAAAWRGLAVAALTFAATAGYPIWTMLRGPWSVSGPVQSPAYTRQLASDLLSFVLPTSGQAIAPQRATRISDGLVGANLAENGSYLGIVLIVLLVLIAWRWRRVLIVQVSAIVGGVAALLSLGERLHLHGSSLGVPLPFGVLARIPVLNSASASRLAIPVGFFAGILLAVGLDRLRAEGLGARLAPGDRAGVVGLGLVSVALIWLVPAWPYSSAPTAVPAYFAGGAAAHISEGSTVLTYPTPQIKTSHNQAMVWQVLDHVRWRLVGSYGHSPGPDGHVDNGTMPRLLPALLDVCTTGASGPTLTPRLAREARSELAEWNVSTIVLTRRTPGIDCAQSIFRRTLGRPGQAVDGVLVYSDLRWGVAR
jgi:hypothetical protein